MLSSLWPSTWLGRTAAAPIGLAVIVVSSLYDPSIAGVVAAGAVVVAGND
jgi:hypothetical protein